MAIEIKKEEWEIADLSQYPDLTTLTLRIANDTEKRAHKKLLELKEFLNDDQFDGYYSCPMMTVANYDFDEITAVNVTFSITDPRTAIAFKMRWT